MKTTIRFILLGLLFCLSSKNTQAQMDTLNYSLAFYQITL